MANRLVTFLLLSIIAVAGITVRDRTAFAQTSGENKVVKILSAGVNLIEVVPSAEKCPNSKGQTVRLKITSESPIDVRLFVRVGYKKWLSKDYPNQKAGEEITDYRCEQKPDYKVYAHTAGSSDAWPKP
jgi:hypothetical protein